MTEIWTPDGKTHTWTVNSGDGELHYENKTAGKRWWVGADLRSYHLQELAISKDGSFVVIRIGYHCRADDAEESLCAYDKNGKEVYSIVPPVGGSFKENTAEKIATLLASGDPEGDLIEIRETALDRGKISFAGIIVFCSREVARLGNRFVEQLQDGLEPDEKQILAECNSEAQRKILQDLFPQIREALQEEHP